MRPTAPLVLAALSLSCAGAQRPRPRDPDAPVPVLGICLAGDAAARGNEYSGLAWHGDELFLLPQWSPRGIERAQRLGGFQGAWVYRIPGARLRAWVDGRDRSPITPERVPFDISSVVGTAEYQGFESIAFDGDRAALTVERGAGEHMSALLVTGTLDRARGLGLDRDALTLDVPVRSDNHAYEALTRVDGSWLALFEVNGMNTACASQAIRVTPGQEPQAVSVEAIPYRITDATAVDAERRFWVTQYSYRDVNDTAECERSIRAVGCFQEAVDCDPRGGTTRSVERLLELRDEGAAVRTTGRVIALQREARPRNWEGVVRLDDRGFVMVTDEWPRTILGFVPAPDRPLPPPAAPCPAAE